MLKRLVFVFFLGACAHSPAQSQELIPADMLKMLLEGGEEVPPYKVGKTDKHGVATIDLVGDIEENAADRFQKALDTAAAQPKTKSILLRINSEGGNFEEGFKMSQAMERSAMPIDCLVDGDAMSAAFYILQSCRERAATQRSIFLAHEPYLMGLRIADRDHLMKTLQEIEVWTNQYASHCASRMKMPLKEFKARIFRKDWSFTPDEALSVNAIDRIEPNPNTRLKGR